MAKFLVLTTFENERIPPEVERRHVDYLRELHRRGELLMAGPVTDLSGGVLIFEVADEPALRAILDADPYATENVWTSVEVRPFRVAVP